MYYLSCSFMVNIFISHPTPHNESQKKFLFLIETFLKENDLNPTNLGKNNWSSRAPLQPIKEIMANCKAAIIIGLERHHSYIGYDREYSTESKEQIHKYSSSPWIQIEAGMAYQAELPLMILKEKKVFAEGILDSNISEYYVFEFEIEKQCKKLSDELKAIIQDWINHIK
jgi:hypothetical protein